MSRGASALRLPPLPDWRGLASSAWAVEAARRVRSTWPSVEAARSSGQALALRVALWRAGVPFVQREQTVALVRFAGTADVLPALRVVTGALLDAVTPLPAGTRATIESLGGWTSTVVDRPAPVEGLEVLVLTGLPGAGKDTWLTSRGLPFVSLDALRTELSIAHGEEPERLRTGAFARAAALLEAGRPFAWNSTLLRARERRGLFEWLSRRGARVTFVSLEVSAALQSSRNRGRAQVVPEAALERMLARWEPLLPGEGHAERFFEDDRPVSFDGAPG